MRTSCLDPNGNVLQTYTCASLPGCQGSLFAMSLDPDGTSFWTGDSTSGDIWQVDIATGNVLQTIDTHSGYLFGLSVDDQIEVAATGADDGRRAVDADRSARHGQLLRRPPRSRPC